MERACSTCSVKWELPRGDRWTLWEVLEVSRSYDSAILIKEIFLPLHARS